MYLQLLLICAYALYNFTNWQGKLRGALLAPPPLYLFNALNIKLFPYDGLPHHKF